MRWRARLRSALRPDAWTDILSVAGASCWLGRDRSARWVSRVALRLTRPWILHRPRGPRGLPVVTAGRGLAGTAGRHSPGEQVHTGGPSMGAATQICAALKDPQRFASLSLLVPPTAWATRSAQTDQYLRSAELVEDHGIGAFVRMGESMLPPLRWLTVRVSAFPQLARNSFRPYCAEPL